LIGIVAVVTCGDGFVEGAEQCDDGGTAPGDGCDASCHVEAAWECVDEPSVCTFCGDGVILGAEKCDDGGTAPGDGCDETCQLESGWSCFGEPSVCTALCDWVTVGDPGNAADDTGYGAVDEVYRITKYEVTNAAYAVFLNAVAATDTYNLYNVHMGRDEIFGYAGITRSGDAGSYTYSVRTGRGDWPVILVSFWDSLRFANWLHNGEPVGVQDNTTTEDGAYTLTAQGIADNTITANVDATVFLPNEDEWYKAAYYAGADSYFDYPVGTDTQTICATPGGTANTANCDSWTITDVGAYTGSASPSGTFDQGGNVSEWTEDIDVVTRRSLRGGHWGYPAAWLGAANRSAVNPADEFPWIGFRVASPPPPPPVIAAEIDIKPGSCPNSWNRESNGVLPVAILGTEDFDVTEIDVSSVTISRADGTGGSVGPNEGPPGPHSVFEDIGTPFEGEECDCHEAEGDGILDLSMKFKTQDVADLLPVDDPSGALVPLVVSGTLLDGTPFTSSSDCVRLVPPGSPPNQVTVQSIAGGWVDAAPLDNNLDEGGFGSFQRTYPHTTVLTLTAPSGHNGNKFVGWKLDADELVQGNEITLVVNSSEHTAEAVFKKAGNCGIGYELILLLPPLLWLRQRWRRCSA